MNGHSGPPFFPILLFSIWNRFNLFNFGLCRLFVSFCLISHYCLKYHTHPRLCYTCLSCLCIACPLAEYKCAHNQAVMLISECIQSNICTFCEFYVYTYIKMAKCNPTTFPIFHVNVLFLRSCVFKFLTFFVSVVHLIFYLYFFMCFFVFSFLYLLLGFKKIKKIKSREHIRTLWWFPFPPQTQKRQSFYPDGFDLHLGRNCK